MDPTIFVGDISEHFLCPICLNVAEEPVEHIDCEKLYCKSCLERVQQSPNNCPTCRQPLRNRTKAMNRIARDFYDRLQMTCTHANKGCNAVFALSAKSRHDEVCTFNRINCRYCQEHLHVKQLELHETTCPKFPASCSVPGCCFQAAREEMDAHLRENYLSHNQLYATRLAQLEEENRQLRAASNRQQPSPATAAYTTPVRTMPLLYGLNRRRRECQYSYDGHHSLQMRIYCGHDCGQSGYANPCGRCNGICGPNNGCQCKPCAELQEELQRRMRFKPDGCRNAEGAVVHVSNNTSPHGEFADEYLFYCGRHVGRRGYPSPCSRCDGKCGPDNGCQCTACFALEQQYRAWSSSASR
eukprot:gene34715-42036_t